MRADRLISVLILLQRHTQLTSAQVADELEISERTARRDLEALSSAGVPVYSTPGRGGGWRLVGGARTDLSGLTAPEVRALFMAASAGPGQSATMRRALGKLQHAVPASFRDEADRVSRAVLWDREHGAPEPPELVDTLQEAIAKGVRVTLEYRDRDGNASQRWIDPLGIVARHDRWYVVAHTAAGRRTFRVDRMLRVSLTTEPLEVPEGFDLTAAWQDAAQGIAALSHPARLSGLARPWVVFTLSRLWGVRLVGVGPPDADGWQPVEVAARSVESAAGILAGFAEALQITGPESARERLAEIGRHLASAYGDPCERPPRR